MAFLDEEIRCDFKISSNRKLLWYKEITMLDWLEEICQKEGLDYFLIGGSEIGVVRHKGFIPWDDDIDIGMLRKYFDKFLDVYKKYLPVGYSVQFGLDKDNGIWSSLVRIRDDNSTGIIDNQVGKKISHGVFIELYCYDTVPADKKSQKRLAREVSNYLMVLQDKIGQIPITGKRGKLLKLMYGHMSTETLVKKIDKLCRSYSKQETGYVSTPILPQYLNDGSEVLNLSDVEKTIRMPFEYTMARIPVGYQHSLTKEFGDYMELPPVEKRGTHHSVKVFYDATKPYTFYSEKSMDELFEKYGFLL